MLKCNTMLIVLLSLGFSQDRDRIYFPHDFHIEEELDCSDCHENVEESTTINDRELLPSMDEVCADCHENAVDEDSEDSDCELCHTKADNPLTYLPFISRRGPDFSHKQHLDTYDDCLVCHGSIEGDDGSEPAFVWKENDCQSCHSYQKPKSHIAGWKNEHGFSMNNFTGDNCALCHDNNTCYNCHQYQQVALQVHNSDYLSIHGFEASAGVYECSTCHSREEDCTSCHTSQNIMPMNHNFPNWVGVFLPNGGEHGSSALDAPDVCQVCHEPSNDPSCRDCH